MSLSTKSSQTSDDFRTLLEVVEDANKFRPKVDHWKFCLKTHLSNGSQSWKPFGVVLPEVVKWLKLAKSSYLQFHDHEKEIRFDPPVKNEMNNLEEAWNDILHKLDEAGERAKGAEVPDWVRFKTKYTYTKYSTRKKELWPLIGAGKGFEYGILVDLVPIFGIATSGAHLNVWTKTKNGIEVWVSRRSIRHANFPGLDDQAVAGGFSPQHKTIKDCIAEESKQEAKGLPKGSSKLMIEYPSIQFCDIRDHRWERGHSSLPEPGIRKVFDLKVGDVKLHPKEDQESFKRKTIEEITASLLAKEWKPNCALVMIDFMIRHGVMPDQKVSGDVGEIKNLLKLRSRFNPSLEIPVIELGEIKNDIKR